MSLLQKIKKVKKLSPVAIDPIADLEDFPIPNYQFYIYFTKDQPVALFQSISSLSVSREVESVPIGGVNDTLNEFPGQVSYNHVTFKSGLSSSDFFYNWMMAGDTDGAVMKTDFTLIQQRSTLEGIEMIKIWHFENAYPVAWEISELSVDNSNDIVFESLELTFDRFKLEAL